MKLPAPRSYRYLLAVVLAACMGAAGAQDRPRPALQAQLSKEAIVKIVREVQGNRRISDEDVQRSSLQGYWEYAYPDPAQGVLLVSFDGESLVLGKVYQRQPGVVAELSASARRARLLSELSSSDYIAFASEEPVQPGSSTRSNVYVFTDVTCPHCRRLHAQIDDYTRLGVEMRYLPFPRHGKDSDGWKQTGRAWCASNRQAALTDLKKGRTAGRVCGNNRVLERYTKLAEQLGVRATPTFVLQDGRKIEGRISADILAGLLSAPRRQAR